jgi:molybdate transport system ATP-binding protein
MTIKIQHASVLKNDTIILDDLNFDIKTGENWAILGGNGSGKTTLLNLLAGRFLPAIGMVQREKGLKSELLASSFQGNRLVNPAFQYYQQRYHADGAELAPTVYEVVQNQVKPLNTIDEKSVVLPPKNFDDLEVKKWANLLKINHLLQRRIVTLSNGETRRTHLLMALLKQPQMLLLDNPFVGLDVESRAILQGILTNIMAAGIQFVIVCAENEIPEGVTHILSLKAGKIIKIEEKKVLKAENTEGGKKQDWGFGIDEGKAEKAILDKNLLEKISFEPKFNDFKYAVRFRNMTIQYGNEKVIDGLSWNIKRGDKWALLGPNGSGKSTLLSLITGDNPQGYGNDYDLFDRKRGSGESIWDIKKRIGFVSPELQLYANASHQVWKIIASGLFDTASLYKPLTPSERETVNDFLNVFNLTTVKNQKLSELSSGQQRLVFLARALIKNPPLLILDEPCQGLDPTNMVYFRELVNELVVSMNKTLIYVTHYDAEIPACVNQVFRIEKGKRV